MKKSIKMLSGAMASAIALSVGLLSSAPVVNAAGISINSSNFPDADFREFVKEHYDPNGDGILSQSEIDDTYYFYYYGDYENKIDVTGIEYFTELVELGLGGCRLESFDASDFKNLEWLDLEENELTSVDLSGLDSLLGLEISYNSLTGIDLSSCPNLKYLYCSSNRITSLDLSVCPNLLYVNCSWNVLSSLDLRKNTKLQGIYCTANDLKSLDLSKNTELRDLTCDNNELTSLVIGPSVEWCSCANNVISVIDLSKAINLYQLYCYDNMLTSLDVSACSWIEYLDASYNLISSIDVSGNKSLVELWLEDNVITELNVRKLVSLNVLSCSNNKLNELDLSNNVNLDALYSAGNNIYSINIGNNPNLIDAYEKGAFYTGYYENGITYDNYYYYDDYGYGNLTVSTGTTIDTSIPEQPVVGEIPAPVVTPAPEKSAGDFVERCYQVALGRPSDEEGFNSWLGQLNNGEACGAQVGFGFIFSGEYQNKNTTNDQYVKDLYAMFFGREADAGGFEYWLSELNAGKTREEVFAGFSNSVEFNNLCNQYGVVAGTYVEGIPASQQGGVNCFVARLYKTCLNRLPDMVGQSGWVMMLINGELTGTDAARGFVFSQEFIDLGLTNEEYVAYMYRAFFGREPDEAGFDAWVTELIDGVSRDNVFKGFANSAEFINLCASYGINA